jgi:hypothetical protein
MNRPPVPFYETSVSKPAPTRRLFVVTYNFPPSPQVGGLRWQKLTRFAAERGWGADVVCLAPEFVVDRDDRRLGDLPANVRVYGVVPREPLLRQVVSALWRAMRRLLPARGAPSGAESIARAEAGAGAGGRVGLRDLARGYVAYIESATMGMWASDAAEVAAAVVGPEHRVVVSSGPPHMAHVGAAAVARRASLPHVVDLRDPWSQVQRVSADVASPLYFALAEKHERAVLAEADLVTTNTEPARRALAGLYPEAAERIITVMNGSDDDPLPAPSRGGAFVIAYAGTIYLDRDPRPLFRAAGRVVRELGLTPDDFGLRFIGEVDHFAGVPLLDMAREAGVEAFVAHGPPRPRREAMQFLAEAAMLVSLPQDSDMAIPAKLFEYVRFDAWLLVLAHPESATGCLLLGSTADVVRPDDEARIAAVIRCRYEEYRRGVRPGPAGADGRFGRRAQAQPLLDALDRLDRVGRGAS